MRRPRPPPIDSNREIAGGVKSTSQPRNPPGSAGRSAASISNQAPVAWLLHVSDRLVDLLHVEMVASGAHIDVPGDL